MGSIKKIVLTTITYAAHHIQHMQKALPPKARRHTKTNELRFDARTPLSRMAGVDLTTIEGIEEGTALVILSEIGTDMHRWPSVKHVCRWLGVCPQHKISGGRGCRGGCDPARLGTPKAITATAHKLARLVYSLLQHGSADVQQGLDAYEAQYCERKVTAALMSSQALAHHVLRGQGERCVPTAPQQRDTPPRGAYKAGSTSQTPSHPPPEPPNHTGEFLGRQVRRRSWRDIPRRPSRDR